MNALANRGGRAIFLCYHSISDGGPHPLTVPPDTFERQLDRLRRRGYVSGTLDDLAALSRGQRLDAPRAFLTFDDGWLDNHATALPILREHGFGALLFVMPPLLDDGGPFAWPELAPARERHAEAMRSITWPMLEEMVDAGVEVGSHTLSHPWLTRLDDAALATELEASRERLRERLGSCEVLSYPFGDWDERVAFAAAAAGYRFAVTLPSAGQARTDPLSIPRLPVDVRDGDRRFALKLLPPVRSLLLSPKARRVLSRRSSAFSADDGDLPTPAPGDDAPAAPPGGVVTAVRDGWLALAGRGTAFTHQPLGGRIDPQGLAGYYCDLRHKAEATLSGGGDGFPRFDDGRPIDYPIAVAQAALGHWELMLEGRDTRAPFLSIADWLVERATPTVAGRAWLSRTPMPKYGLDTGWPSAMGQGEGISVLLRAHDLTGERGYLDAARAALEPMTADVSAGGVLREIDGQAVLEEYPAARPCAVLNGWIFALLGLHELALVTGDEAARELFTRSVAGLLALLPRYDAGWWSLYSLYDHGRPDLAKPFYQRLHPVMLDALALVHPDPLLTATARRWEAQVTAPALARNAVNKLHFRLYRAWSERRTAAR